MGILIYGLNGAGKSTIGKVLANKVMKEHPRIAEELKAKAIELGIEGPHTSWKHMFWWNMLGCLCFGPMIATHRFFKTLNKIETELNKRNGLLQGTTIFSRGKDFLERP